MDDVFQPNVHLHFGAITHISCFRDKTNFYLYSNGISFKSIISLAANEGPTEASMALFRITPSAKFQSEYFLNKMLKEKYESHESYKMSEYQAKIFIYQFEFELKYNNNLRYQQKRFSIKYNYDFMLQHMYSCKYLMYSKSDKSNYYFLYLSYIPTKNCIFNLQACFNYQKDINTYVPFSSAAFLNAKVYEGLEIKSYYLNFKTDTVFDSWTTSEEEKQQISVGLYQTAYYIDVKNICYGDTIWIFHLYSGSFVKVVEKENMYIDSFILKKIKFALGCVQYSEYMNPNHNGKPSEIIGSEIFLYKTETEASAEKFGLWKIVYGSYNDRTIPNRKYHYNRFKGGKVRFDQYIHFFNIRHQKYLSVRRIKIGRNKYKFQLAMYDNYYITTVFRIKSLSPNSIFVTTYDLFLIQHVQTSTYLTLYYPFKVGQNQAYLSPSSDYKNYDNFKFTKIEFVQYWYNNYILSIFPFLREGIKVLEQNKQYINSRDEIILELLVENLIELLTFSYDLTEGFEASENKLGKIIYNHNRVQKLLREQGIIRYLVHLLAEINPYQLYYNIEPSYTKDNLKRIGPINIVKGFTVYLLNEKKSIKYSCVMLRKIVNTSLKVLRNCCKENAENSLLLFTDIKCFIKYLSLNTYCYVFFKDSFSKSAILNKISSVYLRLIIGQYYKIYLRTKVYNLEIFDLLTHLCKLYNSSVSNNQLEIYKIFFYYSNSLLIPLYVKDSKFYVDYLGKQYELNSFVKTYKREGQTVASQIKFYAFLTFGRNYVCSKTIKRCFPLSVLLHYILSDTTDDLKYALLKIFTHAYLDYRPRFQKRNKRVFSLYYIYSEYYFLQGINNINHRPSLMKKSSYDYELKYMRKQGISYEGINYVIGCIEQQNHVDDDSLETIKKWIVREITESIGQSDEKFYCLTIHACLVSLKIMIELSVFTTAESKDLYIMIKSVVKRIGYSLQMQNYHKIELKSTNFQYLLLEMMEKNIIKRYNYSDKFEGLYDTVGPYNVCSLYVNYAFYQNILLQEKNPEKRKYTVNVIVSVLELTTLYNKMFIEDKIIDFIGSLVDNYTKYRNVESKKQLVEYVIIRNILNDTLKGRYEIIKLLLLLFYNSNTYRINFDSIAMVSNSIFSLQNFVENLENLVFIVYKEKHEKLGKIISIYRDLRLLVYTSEIWLNSHFYYYNYQYNSIILYFIDKLKKAMRIVVPGMRDEHANVFDCISGLYKGIIFYKQIILSNMCFYIYILSLLNNYSYLLISFTKTTRNNYLVVKMFRYCFLFLYVFVYNCDENKRRLKDAVGSESIFEYFSKISQMELGQSRLLVEYLKDNYQDCIDYSLKSTYTSSKQNMYTEIHSRLILTLLTYRNYPIIQNLQLFFVKIFDYTSFKQFLWLKDGRYFDINMENIVEGVTEPMFYHINAIDILLYIANKLPESTNIIRNHFKKSLSQYYLFSLLAKDDYFSKYNSIKCLLKLQIIFKGRILQLIEFIYLQYGSPLINIYLQKYYRTIMLFIDETAARRYTYDYRKIIILKDIKDYYVTASDYLITELYSISFNYVFLLDVYLKDVGRFTAACLNSMACGHYHSLCKLILEGLTRLLEILHRVYGKQYQIEYPIPNKLNFTLEMTDDMFVYKRKKYFLSVVLETIYNKNVQKLLLDNQHQSIRLLKSTLTNINLKPFLFLRKITEFLEDAFEKLSQDTTMVVYDTLRKLIKILMFWIQAETGEKANYYRILIGKSYIIFPLLDYFENCFFDADNRVLFLETLEYLNEILGKYGNRTIQNTFNKYFTGKSESINFFLKIKSILTTINFQYKVKYKCRKLYYGIYSFKKDVQFKKEPYFILLNFLINLCKGNYRDNQIFLSELRNVSNFNATKGVWSILQIQGQKYQQHLINVENYFRITQCLSTIRELVEGPCVENQNEFLKRDFFMTVLSYLEYEIKPYELKLAPELEKYLEKISMISKSISEELHGYLNQDKITKNWMPSQVKYRCISLISSLMSYNVTEKSISELSSISPKLLVRYLDRVYYRYLSLNLYYVSSNLYFNDYYEVVLPLGFKIYEVLMYYPYDKIPYSSPGLDFFRKNSRIVEVMHQNLTIVVFPRITTYISYGFKNDFLYNADRTSKNSKLRDLQYAYIQNKQSDYPYGYLVFFFTLVIVLLDLLIYKYNYLQLVQDMTFTSVLSSSYSGSPIIYARAVCIFSIIILSFIFLLLEIRGAVYMQETIGGIIESNVKTMEKVKAILSLFFDNLGYMHYSFLVVLAVLSIFNPIFDSIILILELFRRSYTFFIILKAIKYTMDQLCVVLLINLILTYILASIMYYYFAKSDYPVPCETLYNCFVFTLSVSFKADPGIAGYNDGYFIGNGFTTVTIQDVLVNFSYLFIIKVIMDQIIGAIIVDKFAQIREEKYSLYYDENSTCFICGLERNVLDREEDGFEKHKEEYHNIWNYMEFLIHIKNSKLGNLTGIYRFVYEQYKSGKLSWFPMKKSFHLYVRKKLREYESQKKDDELDKYAKMLDNYLREINSHVAQMQNLISISAIKNKKNT